MTMTWIRRIAIAIGVLIVLLVAAVAVLIATFDAERYKAQAIGWIKDTHQRTLVLAGPIELSVFPRLAVDVASVRLSERRSDQPFIEIDRAALAVQVLPLLRKQLVIDRIDARGVRVAYRRAADGTRNVDDLLTPGAAATADAQPGPASTAAMQFDVSALAFADLALRIDDRRADLSGSVDVRTLKTGRIADGLPTPVTLQATLQLSRPQALKLAFDGSLKATPDIARGEVAASELKLAIDGETAAVKQLSLSLDGALAWKDAALSAGPLKLQLKQALLGKLMLADSRVELRQLAFDPKRQRIELQALQLALRGRDGDAGFDATLEWPQLAVSADSLSGSALSGKASSSGPTTLAARFASAAPSGNFERLAVPGLTIEFDGSSGPRKLAGTLSADLLLRPGAKAVALAPLELKATITEPSLQPLQLALTGKLDADAKAAGWQLAGSLNANRFDSSGRAVFGGKLPMIEARARFDSLDLNKLLPPEQSAAAAAKPQPGKPPPAASAEAPLDLNGLRAVDGRFSLQAGRLDYRRYRIADAVVEAQLDDGTATLKRLDGRSWGGSFKASGSAAAAGNRVSFKLAAADIDIDGLLHDVADKDLLEGKGRVDADLVSHGASVAAMRSNLGGSVALQLHDGAIKGINLAQSLRKAKAALSLKQDAATKAVATDKTDFSALGVSARINDGVAVSNDLELKSPFLRLGGEGRFDIGRGTIDYTARATLVKTAVGQGGADAALTGITVPVRLTGRFDAIDWKIVWSEVAAEVVNEKLKQKLKEKLDQQLGGKLGERLGFGGPGGAAAAGSDAASAPATPKELLKDRLKGLFR